MLPCSIQKNFILTFVASFLISKVLSQVWFENDYRQMNSRCDADSACIAIRNCIPLRDRGRRAGVTCGYGSGSYRRVCCPRRRPIWGLPEITTPAPTTVTDPPRRTTVRRRGNAPDVSDILRDFDRPDVVTLIRNNNNNNNNNNEECGNNRVGRSRWFDEQVMGGVNATEGQWPWMAAIREQENNGRYVPSCTGFFVDRRHVVSAAHCFDRRDPAAYRIRAGRVNQEEGTEYLVTRITIPQDYRRGLYYNDIAILTLDRDNTDPNFSPICLPDEQVQNMDLIGMGTTVAGWGAEVPRGPLSIILKQLIGLIVVPNQTCAQEFRSRLRNFQRQFPNGLSNKFLCAGFPGGRRDSCGGDSGGPLMLQSRDRWYVVGIVSFGISCGEPGVPGGYVRVASMVDWIRENIRDN